MDKGNMLKTIVAAIGTGCTWLFGSWDTALMVLICFMILDYTTGLIKAKVNNNLSSDIGLKGIARKSIILVVLIVAVLLDRLLNTGTWVFRTLVCYFYIANEGLSIIENVVEISLGKEKDVPKFLIEVLTQIREKVDKGEFEKGDKK